MASVATGILVAPIPNECQVHPMSSVSPLVSCRAIRKTYNQGEAQTPALRGADLDIHGGELLILAGPSGCGKTSLISIIGGMLGADSGDCKVLDKDIRTMSAQQRARFRGQHIGFVFQSFNLLPALTAVENVSVPLLLQGVPLKTAESQARIVLESLGLASRADHSPGRMSGGQQQRVAIARALVHEPRLIICDEPTSSLDHDAGQTVMETLRKVARTAGRALLVVTHDPRIFCFADRIARMDDGRVISIETHSSENSLS
ncbi:ABC transporter ATP-binding protein [Undibacterium sp. 14-3-2]|nr:ABC transporter ATP-binding protein [Undibacterium sp. 14-3-2]